MLTYIIALITFLIIDGIWLSVTMSRLYATRIGDLLSATPNFTAAGVFYVLYIAGLTVLILQPALLAQTGLTNVFLKGALFGLVAYATYDLTNLAVLKNWPVSITIIDMIWGALLTGTVSVITVWLVRLWS